MLTPFLTFFLLITSLVCSALAWLPPPDAGNIKNIIESTACSGEKSDFLVLFLVISHPGNIKKRMLTRETYPASEIKALGFRRVFVLGSLGDGHNSGPKYKNISSAEIRAESDKFSDITLLSHRENYYNLTVKCLAAFNWASSRCKQARFIAKTDDDIFIEYYSFRKYIDKIPHSEDDAFIRGSFCPVPGPIRKKKARNFVSFSEYPKNRYPRHLLGLFYFMSTKTMRRLVSTSKSVPAITTEDVYFTGLVAEAMGVPRIAMPQLPQRSVHTPQCCVEHSATLGFLGQVFQCKSIVIEQPVKFNSSHAKRIKQHGRFCYNFQCQPHSALPAPASPKVDCF